MPNERRTVQQLRKERDWTQLDLAYKLKVSLSTVANIEAGRQEPRIGLARKIADTFEVSLDSIEWKSQGEDSPKNNATAERVLVA